MSERENALQEWLTDTISHKDFIITPLAGDASFRRYFRVHYDGLSQVVMDAPPAQEDLDPFIHIAETLARAKVPTPEIIAMNKEQGFLLLSDFGDQLLLSKLQNDTVDQYYNEAINVLFQIQKCSILDPQLPSFDTAFMMKEMSLCPEWFLSKYLSLNLLKSDHELINNTLNWIAAEVSQQPRVFIHRDYHSRNLMILNNQSLDTLGVIDFQDAMSGPVTYDLVSLLKDCYIGWPREKILQWIAYFHSNTPQVSSYSLAEFTRAFDLCGLQRHLKVLGVFCRLHLRDSKSSYLANLSLTLKYVLECTESYKELYPFFLFLQSKVSLP